MGGARTSPPIHQFLVNTLGEVVYVQSYLVAFLFFVVVVFIHQLFFCLQGVKRISKVISGAGKEIQRIVLDHLQVQYITMFTNNEKHIVWKQKF